MHFPKMLPFDDVDSPGDDLSGDFDVDVDVDADAGSVFVRLNWNGVEMQLVKPVPLRQVRPRRPICLVATIHCN